MFWKTDPSIGIDIGSRTIKIIQLKKRSGQIQIEKSVVIDLAKDNEYFPLSKPLNESLIEVVKSQKLERTDVALGLSESLVNSHELNLPKMPRKEMKAALSGIIEDQFQIPKAELCLDFIQVEGLKEPDSPTQTVRAYFTKAGAVNDVMTTAKAANLNPRVVDSNLLARYEALAFNDYIEEKKNFLSIDIGESQISMALIADKKIVQSHVLDVGFGLINKTFFESLGLPYDQAEQIKTSYDLKATNKEPDETDKKMDTALYAIFYKLQRTVDIFKVSLKREPIESILVTGGGSQMSNIKDAIEANCSIPTVIVDPFRKLSLVKSDSESSANSQLITGSSTAPYMCTALGLALRGVS